MAVGFACVIFYILRVQSTEYVVQLSADRCAIQPQSWQVPWRVQGIKRDWEDNRKTSLTIIFSLFSNQDLKVATRHLQPTGLQKTAWGESIRALVLGSVSAPHHSEVGTELELEPGGCGFVIKVRSHSTATTVYLGSIAWLKTLI